MSRPTYIDLLGLTRQRAEVDEYVEALGLEGERIATLDARLQLLIQAERGAGFTILTGPMGAAFWLPVSLEVNVRVVPDGIDMDERLPLDMEWALRANGLPASEARILAERPKPPTPKHSRFEQWRNAERLLARAQMGDERFGTTPIVYEAHPVQLLYTLDEQLGFLDSIAERTATDGEWEIAETPMGERPLHGFSVSNATMNWYLPVRASDYTPAPGHDLAMRQAVMALIKRQPTIWHNAKADLQAFWIGDPVYAYGSPMDDTIVMAYLLGYSDLALKPRTREDLGRDPMDYPKGHEGGLATLPLMLGARYATADTRNTYDLAVLYEGELRKRGRQWDIYKSIEGPLVPVTASMEWGGTVFDVEEARQLHENFWYMHEGIRQLWWARTHCDISTDKGTRAAIKQMTGYDPGSVAANNLAKVEDVWMDSIMAYRKIRHRDRGFLVKHLSRWEASGRPEVYVLHSSFNQAGAADQHDPRSFRRAPRSGRYSSSGDAGNLTNQPGDIRSCFTAPPGHRFWSMDYSGLELHVMAAMSQDANMLRVLGTVCPNAPEECTHDPKCGDLHDAFRADVLARTGTKIERTSAKQGNFSGAYGGGADMLVTILAKARAHIDYDTARLIADTRRETFPASYRYAEAVIARARTNGGFSETYFGRRRYDRDLWAGDRQAQMHAERALVNHTIQGTAADVLKIAMMQALPTILELGGHMALQVHDELCGTVPEENADELIARVSKIMESIRLPGVDLKVTGGHGETWADVH